MYVYSAKTNAFYPVSLKADYEAAGTWPDDGVEVDEETFAIFNPPPDGKMRIPGDNGYPTLVDIPPPTKSELIAAAAAKKAALLATIAPAIAVWQTKLLMGRKLTAAETVSLNAWLDYSDALEAIDTDTAPDIEWPVKPQ